MPTLRRSKEDQGPVEVRLDDQTASVWAALISQSCWIVARKFQFQCFSYVSESGKGTCSKTDCRRAVPSTTFVAADHLTQLIVYDALPREGVPVVCAAAMPRCALLRRKARLTALHWLSRARQEVFTEMLGTAQLRATMTIHLLLCPLAPHRPLDSCSPVQSARLGRCRYPSTAVHQHSRQRLLTACLKTHSTKFCALPHPQLHASACRQEPPQRLRCYWPESH